MEFVLDLSLPPHIEQLIWTIESCGVECHSNTDDMCLRYNFMPFAMLMTYPWQSPSATGSVHHTSHVARGTIWTAINRRSSPGSFTSNVCIITNQDTVHFIVSHTTHTADEKDGTSPCGRWQGTNKFQNLSLCVNVRSPCLNDYTNLQRVCMANKL